MKYIVEHYRGTQGINDRTIESEIIEAVSDTEAIRLVARQDAPFL